MRPERLEEITPAGCFAAAVEATDREEVLRRVSELAAAALPRLSPQTILQGLQERERLMPTAVGRGVALPHCRLKAAEHFVCGALTLRHPVDFAAPDAQPVKLIAFIIAPEDRPREQLQLLSGMARALSDPDNVAALLRSADDDSLRRNFLRITVPQLEPHPPEEARLFQLFVQDADVFDRALQIFGSTAGVTTVVLQGEPLSAYLGRLPLFATFWTPDALRSCRVILAAVSRKLTNETIRRLEEVLGPLHAARGVLLLVQDLYYCAGQLQL